MDEHSDILATSTSSASELIVGKGVRISGDVYAPDGVHLHGIIEGDLDGGHVTMSESGRVQGSLRAQSADISGTVVQGAEISESIILRKQARLTGELRYQTIQIEAGAKLTCSLRVIETSAPALASTPASDPLDHEPVPAEMHDTENLQELIVEPDSTI